MRTLSLALALLATVPAWALEGPAPVAAPSALSTAAPVQAGNSKSVHLGKIEVPGVRPLVEVLQEIKLAVKRPFDNDPAHFDDMVCRLGDGAMDSHITRTLDCGTQGWFSMRRNAYGYGGVFQNGMAAVSTLGHPWHVVRELTPKEMQSLRDVLRELPPPGHEVQVIDDKQAPIEPSR